MLTGELPIGRFAPPSQKAEMDARIDHIVMRTLEKEREARYQSAGRGRAPRWKPWARARRPPQKADRVARIAGGSPLQPGRRDPHRHQFSPGDCRGLNVLCPDPSVSLAPGSGGRERGLRSERFCPCSACWPPAAVRSSASSSVPGPWLKSADQAEPRPASARDLRHHGLAHPIHVHVFPVHQGYGSRFG